VLEGCEKVLGGEHPRGSVNNSLTTALPIKKNNN